LARAPRWIVKRLTRVYVSLSLSEIGKEIGVTDEALVKDLVLSMIEGNEISATLSPTGTLTFLAETEQFTPEAVQKLLSDAQSTNRMLGELDREIGRRPEFLVKALREKEGGGSFYHGMDEDIWSGGGGGGEWGSRGEMWDD